MLAIIISYVLATEVLQSRLGHGAVNISHLGVADISGEIGLVDWACLFPLVDLPPVPTTIQRSNPLIWDCSWSMHWRQLLTLKNFPVHNGDTPGHERQTVFIQVKRLPFISTSSVLAIANANDEDRQLVSLQLDADSPGRANGLLSKCCLDDIP
ncbi:hypothetical protein PIIN_11301 [Serendipita indica DSM 11827]|uniref:Uncharacterized protein n=1 Tax=Serendipita indica (strain DSM 11827) TaxID=1109443 RepID=G4U181_SERID|nr:hypothetical protein PIIN_11301 [Serendipita indica DSM 11827]